MSRLVLGPFNRVEGDLEVSLEVEAGRVRAAQVTAPLYRGFEGVLVGKTLPPFCNPMGMIGQKPLDIPLGCPCRHADDGFSIRC